MVSIDRLGIPFYIIAIDFVIALLYTVDDCDCLLTVIDKFFKRILILSGRTIYDAIE